MNLNVSGVTFGYNGKMVLDDINFCLSGGEVLAVIGVNGAGKTTLLKCLCGILKPSGGAVLIDSTDTARMDRQERARRISYVPQRYVDASMSVYDAVLLGRKPHMGWSLTEHDLQVTEDVLHALHLESMALRQLSNLSGGELQKVIIGRSLAQEPDLLLLDEPTSNLDLRNQMEVMNILNTVAKQRNVSIIVAMHDINTALRFADRFLMLKDGHIHSLAPWGDITEGLICQVLGVDVIMGNVEGHHVVIPAPSIQ
ncbi:MAG TPA: ABC transporter ATP-binding protein [Syntrophorhabdaceae bacterium]|nr:ABC transporter ATP-binding protein [Syntrophorhabdaceae bacterium]